MTKHEYYTYNFNELSEEAKKKAFENYKMDEFVIQDRIDCFDDNNRFELEEKFPNSNLSVEYDFSCSQGSGLNIYGELFLEDLLKFASDVLTQEQKQLLIECINASDDYIKLNSNSFYTYSLWGISYYKEIASEFIYNIDASEEKEKAIVKAVKIACMQVKKYCNELYNTGFDIFTFPDYTINDYEQLCNDFEYEFLESGEMV